MYAAPYPAQYPERTSMPLSTRSTTTALATASLAALATLTACDDGSSGVETVETTAFTDGDTTSFRLEQEGTGCTARPSSDNHDQMSLDCVLPLDEDVKDVFYGVPATTVTLQGAKGFLPVGGVDKPAVDTSTPVLKANQRLEIGDLTCTATGGDALECSSGDRNFTYDTGSFTSDTFNDPWTGTGGQCGDIEKGEFPKLPNTTVRVERGPVDCDEVMKSVNHYLATPTDADHGNANLRKVGDWTCSMPTWGTSQENGLLVDCQGDGVQVSVPKPEPKTCGPAERGRFSNLADTGVTVTDGDIDCAEAVDTFNAYLSSPKHPKNSGNVRNLDINGWQCGSGIMMGANDPDAPMFRCSSRDGEIIIRGH